MSASDTAYLGCAIFNGSTVATEALKISPLGSGFMFGEGVFETVRVQDSQPALFDDHHARLTAAAGCIRAGPISSRAELHERCRQAITANSLVDGSLKIILFKETTGWSEMILARPTSYAPERYAMGFRLKTVAGDLRVDPLHALKTLNYLPNLQAKRAALAAGCDDAVFVDPHRQVLEGATTTLFIVKNGVVSTPPLSRLILPGVMRACVLRLPGPPTGLERDITLDELRQADEVFVTNALLGIMPVARVDTTTYHLAGNSVTRALMAALGTK